MTIHKIVGKHTTGDVRDYVGSAGELFYDDATGLIRLADGFTEGGNALELNQFEDQFVMLASFGGWPEAATSVSTDGVNWTDAFASTEYVDNGDYEQVEFYQMAIGGGHIVYLGWDDNNNDNCLFWAETANQAANRSFSPASYQADDDNGMDTGSLWLEDVQFINNYFVAVGYQQRSETYDSGSNDVKYPFWAYSLTGEHWKYGKIDYSYIRTVIDASDADTGSTSYGIRIESVGGGSNAGMMFTLRFSNQSGGSPGFFYLQDVTGSMNVSTHSGIPPMLDNTAPFLSNYSSAGFRSAFHDDHGWAVWSNSTYSIWFNESANPLEGKWRSSSWSTAAQQTFGNSANCIYWVAAGRLKDGISYLMMTGPDGRYYATSDQGRSWSAGLIGEPYSQNIDDIDTGTTTILFFNNDTDWNGGIDYYTWTKVKITGSNIPEMNGIFYVYRNTNLEFRLSYDTSGSNWVDSTAWTGTYTSNSATCRFSYTENARLYLTYGEGTFIAVDDGDPYVWSTTDLTTPWDWDMMNSIDPVSGDATGNNPIDFTWYAGNWKAVMAQFQWQGDWAGIGSISFGRIGTDSGLLRSQSRRVSGRINSLNLADNFSVGVVNGVQGGENIGYGKIELRPGLPGGLWMIGAGYGYGTGTAIRSENLVDEYNTVAIDIMDNNVWSFRTTGIYYNNLLALATPSP